MKKRVLVVESNPKMRSSIFRILSTKYQVIVVEQGKSIIEEIQVHSPDQVIVDQVEACVCVRSHYPDLLIMVLSQETNENQIARTLDLGADSYVIKPFGAREFEARVCALFRRVTGSGQRRQEPELLSNQDGSICMNKASHQVFVNGNLVHLTATEFALLWQLLLHAGTVMSHQTLLQTVWGPEYGNEDEYLRVYIRHLRRKIEAEPSEPRYLLTTKGVGYVFRHV